MAESAEKRKEEGRKREEEEERERFLEHCDRTDVTDIARIILV